MFYRRLDVNLLGRLLGEIVRRLGEIGGLGGVFGGVLGGVLGEIGGRLGEIGWVAGAAAHVTRQPSLCAMLGESAPPFW